MGKVFKLTRLGQLMADPPGGNSTARQNLLTYDPPLYTGVNSDQSGHFQIVSYVAIHTNNQAKPRYTKSLKVP